MYVHPRAPGLSFYAVRIQVLMQTYKSRVKLPIHMWLAQTRPYKQRLLRYPVLQLMRQQSLGVWSPYLCIGHIA